MESQQVWNQLVVNTGQWYEGSCLRASTRARRERERLRPALLVFEMPQDKRSIED